MKIKKLAKLISVFSIGFIIFSNNVYANNININPNLLEEEDENIEFYLDDIIEKEIEIDIEEDENLATPKSSAKATLTENVGADNKSYPIRRIIEREKGSYKENEEKDCKNKADARQFLTFTTKSGKVFHLIVDHDKDEQNVQLLTEVSEADLLNFIEKDKKPIKKNIKKPAKKTAEKEITEVIKDKEEKSNRNDKNKFIYIVLGVGGVILACLYYLKNKKKSNKTKREDDYLNEDIIEDLNLEE